MMKRIFLNTNTPDEPYTLSPRCRTALSLTARVVLTLAAMALPLAIVWAITYCNGFDISRAVPVWMDDEPWWYLQNGAVSRYGHPLGYFGYAGTHAAVGTFGPWGMYPALLTGTLARLFGWSLHAFVWYNFAYLAGATLIFILLTRPSLRGHIMLAAGNCLMFVAFCYTIVSMNEIVRYSVAIVLAGIMYRLMVQPRVPRWRLVLRCTLIPLLLAYATCFYLVLVLFIPVYLYLMLYRLRPVWRGLIALAVMALVFPWLRRLNGATCAPYVVSTVPAGSAASFAIPNETIRRMTEYGNLVGKLRDLDPLSIMSDLSTGVDRLMLWFCLLGWVTAGVLVWRCAVTWKRRREDSAFGLNLLCLYLLGGCCVGLMLEYNTTSWTFIRNCNTAVCCVMMLAALAPRKEAQPWRTMAVLCLAGAVTFLTVFAADFATGERFATAGEEEAWARRRQALEDVIVLDEDARDPWANTVVPCHTDVDIFYCLPYGVGVNGTVEGDINRDARYVILGLDYDEASLEQERETLEAGGHVLVYEDEAYAVYENQGRSYG